MVVSSRLASASANVNSPARTGPRTMKKRVQNASDPASTGIPAHRDDVINAPDSERTGDGDPRSVADVTPIERPRHARFARVVPVDGGSPPRKLPANRAPPRVTAA